MQRGANRHLNWARLPLIATIARLLCDGRDQRQGGPVEGPIGILSRVLFPENSRMQESERIV